jgi:hypothetical protein
MESGILTLLRDYINADNSDLAEQVGLIADILIVVWAVHIVNWAFRSATDEQSTGNLSSFLGLRPREILGLPGIVCAHFLHGVKNPNRYKDVRAVQSHLLGNSQAFAVLGLFLVMQGVRFFAAVSIAVLLSSGIGTWLFGRENTLHVGASGVLFGYLGFLLIYGITAYNIAALLIGGLIYYLYAPIVGGIFPDKPGISWEMHLFGFLGGVFMALVLASLRPSF